MKKNKKSNKPTIFTKARIANVSAAIVIIWTFYLWTIVIIKVMDGGITISDSSISLSPSMAMVITILGMMNGFTGFAAKYLWDSCTS